MQTVVSRNARTCRGAACRQGVAVPRLLIRPGLAGGLWWWPVAGQFAQPPGVGGRVGLAVFLERRVDVLGDQRGDHVHDVVPVIAEPGEALNRLPTSGAGRRPAPGSPPPGASPHAASG